MSPARLALRQVAYEQRAFRRNPPAAFFTIAFPLLFLVLFNLLFGNDPIRLFGRTLRASAFYVPAIAAFSIVTSTFTNVAMSVTFDRDQGVLKRIRGTPLPGWAFLAGKVLHASLVAALLVGVITAAGVAYGVPLPTRTLPAVALSLLVGAAAFCALGLAMTAAVPNAEAAPAVVNAVALPLLFVSDVFIRTESAPEWLTAFADLFPIRHLSEALQQAFNATTGSGLAWGHLAAVAAWGVAGVLLALRFFSWEPRR